jgi:quercetin dioxygenase-like cupin family protein
MAGNYPDIIRSLPHFGERFDAHKLKAEGCDILFASYPAGTSVPTHKHDTDNHGVITRGALILTIQDKVTQIRVGEWYHVPAHVKHSAKFEEDTDEIDFWFIKNK